MTAGDQTDIRPEHDLVTDPDVRINQCGEIRIDENIVSHNEVTVEIQVGWMTEEKITPMLDPTFQEQGAEIVDLEPTIVHHPTHDTDND